MAKYLRKPKTNIPMCIAAVLFCLTVISTYMVSGLFARYTTTGAGKDNARVIKFGDITITQTGDPKAMIIPGVDIQNGVTVSFTGSESATYVFVKVDSEKWTYADRKFNLGTYMNWEVADGWTPVTDSEPVFYKSLKPNEILKDAPVIKDDLITVSRTITKSIIGNLEDTISFRASVVQSNGFESPAAAWASLERKGGAAG